MRLPLINLPTVYHVGALDPEKKGEQYTHSFEGAWLSASLCPEAWTQIARLGGQPTWALCKPDALYVDVHNMGIEKDLVMHWAEDQGLIQSEEVFRVSFLDSEAQSWRWSMHATEQEAKAEIDDLEGQGLKYACSQDSMWLLTEIGRARAKQGACLIKADDFALQFWLEDILRERMPQVVGLYWDEEFDPGNLSAPRAAIIPEALESMKKEIVSTRYLDEDESLLDGRPIARLLSPEDLNTPYRYVTNCVSADGDSINKMIDDPACRDISYQELVDRLGNDAQALLDSVFPEYQKTADIGLTLENDRCVTYYESSYEGVPCLYVCHSAIEYIFQREGLVDALQFQFKKWLKTNPACAPT